MGDESLISMLLDHLTAIKGIKAASLVERQHREEIMKIEQDAEEKALMGLGRTYNSGLREVLECEIIIAALTDMDFDWSCVGGMQLKKGNQLVGEEIRDPDRLKELSQRSDVYFLHSNFVIYKEKINFPKDLMNKICHFEFPCICVEWFSHLDKIESCVFCNPSTPTDLYIKKNYFEDKNERGLGTILVGITLHK